MSEIKVRVLDGVEAKSTQEIEKELLEKHEEQFVDNNNSKAEKEVEAKTEEAVTEEAVVEETKELSFNDDDVLSYIGKRYGKEIDSLDQLFEERSSSEELPEDVAAYFKYKKETGRSIEDFVKLNRDFDDLDPDKLLASYYQSNDADLDDDDIQVMLEEFEYDEDLDEEKVIKKRKLAKKKALSTAKKFFNEQKEQYKVPLESRKALDSNTQEELDKYRQESKTLEANEERQISNRKKYLDNVQEIFHEDFKGFEFKIDDQTLSYLPAGIDEVKTQNTDITNWVKKYTDKETGVINDYQGFHKALAIANYPDKFAKFFYDKGKTDAVVTDAKTTKNVDYSMKRTPEVSTKGGMQIKAVSPSSDGNRLRIRKRK